MYKLWLLSTYCMYFFQKISTSGTGHFVKRCELIICAERLNAFIFVRDELKFYLMCG